jgi:hypothetical protein
MNARLFALLICLSALYAQTGPSISIYSGSGGFGLTGTRFFPIGGGGNPPNSVESVVQTTITATTTLSRFGVRVSNPLGAGNVAVFTVRNNAADTSLTCTITNPAMTCQDVTHTVNVAAGDVVATKAVFNSTVATGSSPIVTFSMQIGAAGVAPGQITLILSGACPAGFSEVAALSGKTLIGTTAAAGNVGTTGGADSVVPSGTVAAPIFFGTSMGTHTHVLTGLTQNVSAGTPTGTVGSINATGTPTLVTSVAAGQNVANFVHTHPAPTFTGVSMPTHNHAPGTLANSAVSAGTPAGTIAAPAFTGVSFDNRSSFIRVIFCSKD